MHSQAGDSFMPATRETSLDSTTGKTTLEHMAEELGKCRRSTAVADRFLQAAAGIVPASRCHRFDMDLQALQQSSERACALTGEIDFFVRFKKTSVAPKRRRSPTQTSCSRRSATPPRQ